MRKRLHQLILHFKTMLFAGQNIVEFSGANYSADAFVRPHALRELHRRSHLFSSETSHRQQLQHQFDDSWVNTVDVGELREYLRPLTRRYGIFPMDPSAELLAVGELPLAFGHRRTTAETRRST